MSCFYGSIRHVKAAKKQHRCMVCEKRILVGTPYVRWAGTWEGDFGFMKVHPECDETSKNWTTEDWQNGGPPE